MRMSCNGCRVLRKGCSDDCIIRPCLQWIKSADSQANATVFLAKFYGRAGLINLINAGPPHLRPAVFRSLLYEACGRIINPIYGSVGLLWSGNWGQCQAAVDAVLKGSSHIMRHPSLDSGSTPATSQPLPPLKAYDIRHFPKAGGSQDLHRVRARNPFKRPRLDADPKPDGGLYPEASYTTSPEDDSVFSVETLEAEPEGGSQPSRSLAIDGQDRESDDDRIGLELTLGVAQSQQQSVSCKSEAHYGHHL
ncbi:LOB domain-containing protein 42-like [Syzygium oleosum]|uniref:LOB domain-containing protein 42-like n=1 Tax=Syzygium oleosum TaxID=219896 RepID=UPI0011D227E9|nr:LOB domain-containing protein 42-like [Syzygium oleosum]